MLYHVIPPFLLVGVLDGTGSIEDTGVVDQHIRVAVLGLYFFE